MTTLAAPRGRQSKIRLAYETTYGVNPAAAFFELNTYANDLVRARALEADDILGAGFANNADARPAAPNVEDASAKISAPFDLAQMGYWLSLFLGHDTVTGSGTFTHTWNSGAATLPTGYIERELVAAAQYDAMSGVAGKSLKLPFKPGKGYNMLEMDFGGAKVLEPYTGTAAGTPTVAALANRVPNSVGVLKVAGAQIGQVIDATLTLSLDMTLERYVGSSSFVAAAILDGFDVAVDMTARYSTDALRALGALGANLLPTLQSVEMDWVIGATSLTVTLPAVRFEPVNLPINNGKSLTQTLKGRAEVGSSLAMMTAVLINSQSGVY